MKYSNRTVALTVLALMSISIIGLIFSIDKMGRNNGWTGMVTTSNTTGITQIAISSQTVLRFVVSGIDFGTGQINTSAGYYNCTLFVNDSTTGTINKSAGCVGFNSTIGSTFTLQNAGTTYLNVTMNFSANASGFIGGSTPAPSFQFAISNNGTGTSCIAGVANGGWTEVALATKYNICQNLSYYQNNTLMMGVKIVIPADTYGSKNVTIIAQGTG